MIKKFFGSFLLIFFAILIMLFFRTGAYKNVDVQTVETPQLRLYYKEKIGPYHKIIKTIEEVEKSFKELNLPCKKTFGHFLSDPAVIKHNRLVSHVGCAFEKNNTPELFTLPKGIKEKMFSSDLKNKTCYKGSFSGSPSLSAIKVYPKIKEIAKKNNITLNKDALEVYTISGEHVTTDVYICGKNN